MLPEIIPNWHPIFVHFTIALFSIATLLIMSSLFIKNDFRLKILEAGKNINQYQKLNNLKMDAGASQSD